MRQADLDERRKAETHAAMTNSTPAPKVWLTALVTASSLQGSKVGQRRPLELSTPSSLGQRETRTHDWSTTGGSGGWPLVPGALKTCLRRPAVYICGRFERWKIWKTA